MFNLLEEIRKAFMEEVSLEWSTEEWVGVHQKGTGEAAAAQWLIHAIWKQIACISFLALSPLAL